MAGDDIEQQAEKDFALLTRFTDAARQRSLTEVEALIERISVELMLKKPTRRRKALYRASIDLLEDVLDERYEKEKGNRQERHYLTPKILKTLFESIDE